MLHENLCEKVNTELEMFRGEYEKKSALEVYNDWYEIGFYESYSQMLISNYVENLVGDDVWNWLASKENPLGFLYSEWLSCDGELSYDWDDMVAWIQSVFDEEKSLNIKNPELDELIESAKTQTGSFVRDADEHGKCFEYFVPEL